MIAFLVTYNYIFYWSWLGLLFIRAIANHYVFVKRGEETMKDIASPWRPDYEANILIYFTFYFEGDDTDSEQLKQKVQQVNRLHLFFAVYSGLVFILFLLTYGK